MAMVVSTINMKGGVGKTTLSVNLAACLARDHNKKVLLVDLDPQTNATMSLITPEKWEEWTQDNGTLADVLGRNDVYSMGEDYPIEKSVLKNAVKDNLIPSLDLIPSHLKLTFLDLDLAGQAGREHILDRKIESIKDDYDFIICDCPPNLTIATQNALVASDYYLIPIQPDFLSSLGLGLLYNRVVMLSRNLRLNNLKLLGIVFTRVDNRLKQTRRIVGQVEREAKGFDAYIFETQIPKNVSLSEAPEESLPVILYRPNCKGAKAFDKFTSEFMQRVGANNE